MASDTLLQEVIISKYPLRSDKAPRFILLDKFKIHLRSLYIFEGCVKICRGGGLALRLFSADGQDKLPQWKASVVNPSGTVIVPGEKELKIDLLTSTPDESEWTENNSVNLSRHLFLKNDGELTDEVELTWTIEKDCESIRTNERIITCKVTVSTPANLSGNSITQAAEAGSHETGWPRHADPEEYYKMDACPRGLCLVIVNSTFHEPARFEDVPGFRKDRDDLKAQFQKLHFTVEIRENQTALQIRETLEQVAGSNHTSYDCFVSCIMSHGGNGHVYGTDGVKVKIHDLTELFSAESCHSLAGKPKLFFIQACRGVNKHYAVRALGPNPQMLVVEEGDYVASKADFLQGLATVENYVALCDPVHGGWYIQALVEQLENCADKYDIHEILRRVNCTVAEKHDTGSDGKIVKQAPEQISSLRNKLVFFKLNQQCQHSLASTP